MKKSVYMTILGFSIAVAAVSIGVTLTRFLGLLAYSPKGTAQAAATPTGPKIPSTPPEQWNNLFAPGDGMKLASRLPSGNGTAASQATRTRFVLVGTIGSSTPSARRAVLWANGMKEPKAFREKEEVEPGAILSSVERDKVWINRGGEREKLEILPVGSQGRPVVSPGAPPRPGAAFSRKKPLGSEDKHTRIPEGTAPAAPGEPEEPEVTGRSAVDELPGMRPIYMFISDLPGSGCESRYTSRYWGFPSLLRRVPSA